MVDDEGRASFAVPLAGASHPVHVVSEGGGAPIPVLFGEEPPPPQLAAWAPRHPNHRRDLLAVVATSGVLTVYNIDAPASATSVALPLQHFSVKQCVTRRTLGCTARESGSSEPSFLST